MSSGMKETKEMVVAINEVILCLLNVFKDGVGVMDFVHLFESIQANDGLRSKLSAAYENYKSIPEEVGHASPSDTFSIVLMQMEYLSKILEALKK